jgi:TRAP-type C4-dicarboxylate transport system permease small subunit
MRRAHRIAEIVGWVEEALCMGFLVAIAVVINLQVVSRYVMDDPFIWPEEVSRMLMIWATWTGAAAVTRRGLHIRFDMLLSSLPPGVARINETAIDLLAGALFLFLAYQGVLLTDVTSSLTMAATELPTSLLVWPLAAGSALGAFHSALRIMTRWAPVRA